ncbi:MAG: hypothetical protein ACRDKB_09005 [Actinomycetota bacterium]
MPTEGFSAEIRERALDLAWSLWAELGVSGWRRHHQDWGIDPEPLVIFTASIADLDPRLRDESLDWCIRFGHYLSRARLRNLLRGEDDRTVSSFGTYSATVNAHSTLNWPGSTNPLPYQPTGRSDIRDFTAPALLALRLRALLGVSARAEAVRLLMAARAPLATSDIAGEIDYTKRNVADALESLRLAGVVFSERHRNAMHHRLNRTDLRGVATPLPKLFPAWKPIFRVISGLLVVEARQEALSKAARAVEARRVVESLKGALEAASLRRPDLTVVGEDFWQAFSNWATETMTGLAFAESSRVFDRDREPTY